MRLFIVLIGAVSLYACTSVYDTSAMPAASQANKLGYEQCSADLGRTLKTHVAATDCYLASDLRFAKAIKLQNMELYNTYAARMRLIAVNTDAGRISHQDWVNQITTVQKDYMSSLGQAYAQEAADNAAEQQTLGAAAAAFGQGYAQGQANQPKPVICTSTQAGGMVNTICN